MAELPWYESARTGETILAAMDRLWTPWRYNYVTGADEAGSADRASRKGVPAALEGWPDDDAGCVFCNLIRAVEWGIASGMSVEAAERAGLVVARGETCFTILNKFPYTSGHLMVLPYQHTDSLAKVPAATADELIRTAQALEWRSISTCTSCRAGLGTRTS
jgi:ATP adenylyltransferase